LKLKETPSLKKGGKGKRKLKFEIQAKSGDNATGLNYTAFLRAFRTGTKGRDNANN